MRLSQQAKETIKTEIHHTLQRMRGVLQCPLTIEQHVLLWESQFTAADLAARDLVLEREFCRISDLHSAQARYLVGDHTIQVLCQSGPNFLTSFSTACSGEFERAHIRTALGEAGERFIQWIDDLASAEALAAETRDIAETILEMANTAGQLTRMVPELKPFLAAKAMGAVGAQQTSSRLPPAWAAFDRERLNRTMNFLTKCSLLEPIEFRYRDDNVFGFVPAEPHFV